MQTLARARLLFGHALLIGAMTAGCAATPPTAPTAEVNEPARTPAGSGTLTIRVLARSSERPIAGATISTTNARIASDSSGVGTLVVVPGQEVDVQVSAAGYDPMGASAVVGASEQWTFYLPPTGGGATPSVVRN